jgi:peroxiredoxin Q/BCP
LLLEKTNKNMSQLKAGDKAPVFSATNQDGNQVSLNDYSGKRLVLYFYPKDDTPGCTAEACSLRDNFSALREAGYEVLGVSPDPAKSHLKFIDKYSLPFSLLADTDHKVAEAFGVYGLKKFMGREYMGIIRTTFLIDGKGVIEQVISKVDTKNHARQIL